MLNIIPAATLHGVQLVVVTGLSGAGRSTALRVLEDDETGQTTTGSTGR